MLATIYTKLNPITGELTLPETYVFDGNKKTWGENPPFNNFSNLLSVVIDLSKEGNEIVDVLKSRIEGRISLEESQDILRQVFSSSQIEVKDHTPQNSVTSGGLTAKISYRSSDQSGITGIYTNKYGKDGITFYLWTLEGEVSDFPETLRVMTNLKDHGSRLWFKGLTNEGEEISVTVWNQERDAPFFSKGDVLSRLDGKKFYIKTHEQFGRQISIGLDNLQKA